MNNITIVGNIGSEPEIRTTNNGGKMAKLSVAVRRFKPDASGNDSDWFNVTAWGRDAEYIENYATKGAKIAVCGRVELRTYDKKDGGQGASLELSATGVSLVSRVEEGKSKTTSTPDDADPFDYD